MNLRMFLHACVHMCVLCTHHDIHDMVYNIFLFIDNIHVYAQYMYMIQYTATSVLHVGPVTACIVLHMEYSCICHVHALPQWALPMCVHTLYKNKRARTCMPSTCLAESFMQRTCMYIHTPVCVPAGGVCAHTSMHVPRRPQRGRLCAKPHACASPCDMHHACAWASIHMHTCGPHGPHPRYIRHVLCMWPACIHNMHWTSGKHMQHAWSR